MAGGDVYAGVEIGRGIVGVGVVATLIGARVAIQMSTHGYAEKVVAAPTG